MKLFAVITLMANGQTIVTSIWDSKESASSDCDWEWGDYVVEFTLNGPIDEDEEE